MECNKDVHHHKLLTSSKYLPEFSKQSLIISTDIQSNPISTIPVV
jgi:hypothetical protein